MKNLFYFLQAKRRWESNNKTIELMDGVANCPYMLLAQKDMLELEMEHYKNMFVKSITYIIVFMVIVISFFIMFQPDITMFLDDNYSLIKNKIGELYESLG